MTDSTSAPTNTPAPTNANKDNAPRKRAKTNVKRTKGYTVPDIARAFLKARGVSAPSDARIEKAGKTVRGIIRSHKSELAKGDPAIKRHTKGAEYGLLNKRTHDRVVKNRWAD